MREDREQSRRRRVTPVHIRPLGAGDPRDEVLDGLSPEARLELVGELSARMWELTGRPVPAYERSEVPVRVVSRT